MRWGVYLSALRLEFTFVASLRRLADAGGAGNAALEPAPALLVVLVVVSMTEVGRTAKWLWIGEDADRPVSTLEGRVGGGMFETPSGTWQMTQVHQIKINLDDGSHVL